MPSLRPCILLPLRRRLGSLGSRCHGLRDESGSALVELALTLSLLGLPLLMGTVHFSTLLIDSIVVANAAHAGAQYAMTSSTFASDTSNIQAAAQADASDLGVPLTVTPTIFYVCSTAISGTQFATQAAATSACSNGGSHALQFVQVVASATVTPVLTLPGVAKTVTLTSTSIMEVEE